MSKNEPERGWEPIPAGYMRCTRCGRYVLRAFVEYVNGRLRKWSPAPCRCLRSE